MTSPEPSAVPARRLAPGEDGRHVTFCRNCEAFCGLEVEVKDGRAVKILPDRLNPSSRGHACVKGTAALGFVYDEDRVSRPLRRVGAPGEFEPVSWDEAMSDIAGRLAKIMREDGPDAVANYIGNPAAFNTGLQLAVVPFLNHFGVWKKFSSNTQDATARLAASFLLYGTAYRLPIPDLPRCDTLFIFGANPLASHGSILTAPRISEDLDAIAKRGRIVVFDPRRTETAARYEHVQLRPDSDAWLLMAMANAIFEAGAHDEERLLSTTIGLSEFRRAIVDVTPEAAERYCGVPAATIRELALAFAATPRAAAYGRVGICRGRHATLVNVLLDALNIVAGKFGIEGGWVFGDPTIDMANTRPSMVGPQPTRFGPRPSVAGVFQFSQLAEEIIEPGEGRVRALFMQSGNMLLSAPGVNKMTDAVEKLDLFVSSDLYMNETNRYASYILPGTSFLERRDIPLIGLSFMVRPTIQYTEPVIPGFGEARNESAIYTELASRLHDLLVADPGRSGYAAAAPPRFDTDEGIERMLQITPTMVDTENGPQLITLDLLKAHPRGLQVAENLRCTDSLTKIAHDDGRIHLWGDVLAEEFARLHAAEPAADGALRLFGLRRYQSMNSWMHNVDRLVRTQRPVLMVHPTDAEARGIGDGDLVELSSSVGSVTVPAKLTEDVSPGSVCYPHGFGHHGGWKRANAAGGANINLLADPQAGDRFSASAHLDGIDVVLRRSGKLPAMSELGDDGTPAPFT
jgi:formate dehydrogenase